MNESSKSIIFDPIKLEKLLIKDWANYIDPRKLLTFIKSNVKEKFNINEPKINTIMISNCELNQKGIILWINYNIMKHSEVVNATTEVLLNPDGTIENLKTI